MNRSQHTLTKGNALRHCQRRNKSRSIHALKFQTEKIHSKQLTPNPNKFPQLITSNSLAITSNKQNTIQTINVITRNRPQIETSARPIIRRFRAPNRRQTTQRNTINRSPTRSPLIAISTQTDDTDNTGKGRDHFNLNYTQRYFY